MIGLDSLGGFAYDGVSLRDTKAILGSGLNTGKLLCGLYRQFEDGCLMGVP